MDNRYHRHHRRKYCLKVYIILVTKYRKKLLQDFIEDEIKQRIYDICYTKGYDVIAMKTNLIGSSHHPRAVGGAYDNRKDFIYERSS